MPSRLLTLSALHGRLEQGGLRKRELLAHMTPLQFITKWSANTRTERAASQSHFNDLCDLLGHPKPLDVDPIGDQFTFEKGATKLTGGEGFADVWKKHCFAWEYKGKHGDLDKAYAQLKRYADALENPPLLIVSDMRTIVVHTAFTNAVKKAFTFSLTDLEDAPTRQRLKAIFTHPETFRPGLTRHAVTRQAAERFTELAHHLRERGFDPHRVAHFLNRLIFCMFAEDVGLLPNAIFSKMVKASVQHPNTFVPNARTLFHAMAQGGVAAFEPIEHFNGGLFDNDDVLPLEADEVRLLDRTTDLDWSNIEPSILGTLFERGLDPDKRAQQGAHYTDPDTIMKLVLPVVVEPWERAWEVEKPALAKLIGTADKKIPKKAADRFNTFLERLRSFRVLDPACGSGNFLYLALRALKNLEKRVIQEAESLGFPPQFPSVGPEAVLGLEINDYAAELARVSIWIGELQWQVENGFPYNRKPVLRPLNQIECRDALISSKNLEAQWPKSDVIVGNPPFLGGKLLRGGLGDEYVETLFRLYAGRVPAEGDLVAYWFEKATDLLRRGEVTRVGLVATQGIRGGANRKVLERAVAASRITDAWSDLAWVNEGADVRVSLIAFAVDSGGTARLDGKSVDKIHPDLTAGSVDITQVQTLAENRSVAFMGDTKGGAFDISGDVARDWIQHHANPNGKSNSDVLKPWVNGFDVTRRHRDMWIVDFGWEMGEAKASQYQAPFEYLVKAVRPERQSNRRKLYKEFWWRHVEPRPGMWAKLRKLQRYIVTVRHMKHRIFTWCSAAVCPDSALIAIARDDDATFGVLQSRFHELWSLRLCTWIGVGNDPRYTPSTTFETFPFPEGITPPETEGGLKLTERVKAVRDAGKQLNELRENWLNPPEWVELVPDVASFLPHRVVPKAGHEADLKRRTLTLLYNEMPAWLQHAHADLDRAVAAAYGWNWPLTDDEIASALFALNGARHKAANVKPTDVSSKALEV